MTRKLEPPIFYRPFLNGVYSVSAGLFRLGQQAIPWREEVLPEQHIFALDGEYARFVQSKVAAHRRAVHEYAGEAGLWPDLREVALSFIAARLAQDSGGAMSWDGQIFRNVLLGWEAELEPRWGKLGEIRRFDALYSPLVTALTPLNALDFLGLNAPEDLAVVARNATHDYLAAVHVLSPQHWNPLDKLGRDFVAVHAPVAGSGPLNRTAPRLIEAMMTRGPFVRFAWGISLGDRLDHHPNAAADQDRSATSYFDPADAFLRVERQTLTGFPAEQGALFTIRPYTYPLRDAVSSPAHARLLAAALRSMTPEQVTYKGLAMILPDLLQWLDQWG